MTIADTVESLLSYSMTDWTVSESDERKIVALLAGDSDLGGTLVQLEMKGALKKLLERVDAPAHRSTLLQLIAGRTASALSIRLRPLVASACGHDDLFTYDVTVELHDSLAKHGLLRASVPGFAPSQYRHAVGIPGGGKPGATGNAAPFSGSGATGQIDLGLATAGNQARAGAAKVAQEIWDPGGVSDWDRDLKNPILIPDQYAQRLTSAQRTDQAKLLFLREIASRYPYAYCGPRPSRAEVIRAAARTHNLDAALVGAFILLEQRDQSANEDAIEFLAAIRVRHNSSIGLGQVKISTATIEDLFVDLLPRMNRAGFGHIDTAYLLASEELNIFATARYMRIVANHGANQQKHRLPATAKAFPKIDFLKYAGKSTFWPDDNVAALASEYTSKPWDDIVGRHWGKAALQALEDAKASGAF